MPGPNTISFPDPDPVTGGPPTIDGWTGNQDPGLTTTKMEPGYATGDRLTFEGGSAFPPVTFQCVRVVNPAGMPAGTYLALGFFCSFDVSFDDADVVVLALRTAGQTGADHTRRIDIHPVRNGIGAGLASDSEVVLDGTPAGSDFHVRIDRTARALNSWKGHVPDAGDPRLWLPFSTPSTIVAKCCSWRPAVPSTQTSGATAVPAGSSTTFTMNVVSTGGLPPAGAVVAPVDGIPRLVSYESKTPTSLVNCRSAGGAGSIPSGSVVTVADVGWSLEVLVPTTTAAEASGGGTADWIALNDGFGVYFNIVRLSPSRAGGTTFHSGYFATQYVFPVGGDLITGTLDDMTTIAAGAYGTAKIPAAQVPPGSSLGIGVGFQNTANPAWSIGARDIAAAAGTAPTGDIQGPVGAFDNRLVAQIQNNDPANAASNVSAEFRLANWGLPPATFPAWAEAVGSSTPTVINLPAGGSSGEVTADWLRANVPSGYGTHKHQCMWVRLTSTSTVHFFQGGARRNMDFVPLSEHSEPVELSGVGYGPPATGANHEFILIPHVREVLLPDFDNQDVRLSDGGQSFKKVWVWIVDGFRRTTATVTIDGVTAEILDPTPGQFGLIATHDDPNDVLGFQIDIPGIRWNRGGFLTGPVPHEGSVVGTVRLHAAPPDVIANEDEEIRRKGEPATPVGCLRRILKLFGLAAIGMSLTRLLRR